MQEDYSDFEIIALDPNLNYETDDDESEMEYEDTVVWNDNYNKVMYSTGDKTCDFETELNDQHIIEDEIMCIVNNQKEELINVKDEDAANEEESMELFENNCESQKPRKKLNLAEYKIRRANKPQTVEKFDKNVVLELCENIPETLPILELPTDPRSIKNLLESNQQKDQLKEEHNVSEIIEITSNVQAQSTDPLTIHPDYEEIVLVSMECQTEISISPQELNEDCERKSSSGFLTNIVNSFQHSNNAKTILSSTSTLLSSINAVLNEKRSSLSNDMKEKINNSNEHGENKVIMHLKKDRIRPFRNCAAIQTEISPIFPPLILSPALIFNRIKNARNFRRRSTSRSHSRSRSRSISPEPEYYCNNRRRNYKYSRSVNSSSMNSSEMDSSSESDTSAYGSCRSSDHDSIKRFDNRFKRGYQRPNYNFQERKIIYVGGLLEETTKDELRRKFLKYGTIKKISLHTKEDGSLRYGFVTFAESSAAYDVLDRFSNDPAISNFDLRFGGRRKFCRQTYADLDSQNQEDEVDLFNNNNNNISKSKTSELSFEDLLNMTKRKLCKNK